MPRATYHTHSRWCDGAGEIADYVAAGRALGLHAVGISSHAPVPIATTYAMALDVLPAYRAEVEGLRDHGALLSLELDALPEFEPWYDTHVLTGGFDYLIGSIHYIGHEPGGRPWDFDLGHATFRRGLEGWYEGNVRRVVEDYYAAVRRAAATRRYDVIGHVDRVKKYNEGGRYFDESAPWYRDAVAGALEACAAAGVIVELNTAGWRGAIAAPYPSEWIVRRCRELGIRTVISSDAHRPEDLTAHFDRAETVLRDAGYREVEAFENGRWASAPL